MSCSVSIFCCCGVHLPVKSFFDGSDMFFHRWGWGRRNYSVNKGIFLKVTKKSFISTSPVNIKITPIDSMSLHLQETVKLMLILPQPSKPQFSEPINNNSKVKYQHQHTYAHATQRCWFFFWEPISVGTHRICTEERVDWTKSFANQPLWHTTTVILVTW